MAVDPARAALVQQPFARLVTTQANAPGIELLVVSALADDAGAAAFSGRIAPLARAGLSPVTIRVFEAADQFEPGDIVQIVGGGPKYIVTGVSDDHDTDAADLTLRGPEPA